MPKKIHYSGIYLILLVITFFLLIELSGGAIVNPSSIACKQDLGQLKHIAQLPNGVVRESWNADIYEVNGIEKIDLISSRGIKIGIQKFISDFYYSIFSIKLPLEFIKIWVGKYHLCRLNLPLK